MFFTGIRAVPAEGARIGFATCTLCGAAVLLDDDDFNVIERHIEWHVKSDTLHGYTASGEQVTVRR